MNVQRYARIAGVLVLISLIAGGFGEAYVPRTVVVSGDAAATVANIKALDLLFRLGFAAFLVESLCDIALALILYAVLKPVSSQLSLLAAFFGLAGTTLFAAAELFFFLPTFFLSEPAGLTTFSSDQLNQLVMLSIRFFGFGVAISSLYYGMGWLVRGYLMFRSGYLPKFLGVLMAIGGLEFVVQAFGRVFVPRFPSSLFMMLLMPGGLALTIWLLVKGVDMAKWEAQVGAADTPGNN
jgi:hypothetical protein